MQKIIVLLQLAYLIHGQNNFNIQVSVAEDGQAKQVYQYSEDQDVEVSPIQQEQEYYQQVDNIIKVAEKPQNLAIEDGGYAERVDTMVNCTDYVPQEQIDSGYKNCSEVIESLATFQNLGLSFSLCESEVVWRWGYCQQTCGLCEECKDTPYPGVNLQCDLVKNVGLCMEMDIYKDATYCARSCETCNVLAQRQGGSGCYNAYTIQCDIDALLEFKSGMSESAKQSLSSWVGDNPCDSWKGITCNSEGQRVTKIQLGDFVRSKKACSCGPSESVCSSEHCRQYYNSTGYLHSSMFMFQDSNDSFIADMYTSIPPKFSQLTYLQELQLTGNEIIGTIPPELSQLTQLQQLILFDNKINGSIPSELSALTQMQQEMHLGSNDLSGSIPKEFSVLGNLWGLYLFDNYLSGVFPNEFTELGNTLHILNIEPQYDDNLCVSNESATYIESHIQMETDIGQLTIC